MRTTSMCVVFAVACGDDATNPCPTLSATAPAAELQFDTNPDSGLNRPDSAIAAGPSHLVTAVNFQMQVQDLDGANPTSFDLNEIFLPTPTAPAGDPTESVGDPRLVRDTTADRFVLSALGFHYGGRDGATDTGDSYCDLAVSQTSDPRGEWHKFTFHVLRNGNEQMDFDSLGYDAEAIYVTARMRTMFTNGDTTFAGNRILILDKAVALAGGPLTETIIEDLPLPDGSPAEIVKPVEPLDAAALAGPTLFLTQQGTDKLVLYTLTDPLGKHEFTPVEIPITPWAAPGNPPQKGAAETLQLGASTVLQKATQRNGTVWTARTVAAPGSPERSAVVVYEIDPVLGILVDEFTLSDPALSFFMPAVVPDESGNVAVVFGASDANHFASIFYSRLQATESEFEIPAPVSAGTAAYTDPAWGDYSDAAPDVANTGKVWLHAELPTSADTWKMHAARVSTTLAPTIGCAPPPSTDTGGSEGLGRVSRTLRWLGVY